MNNRASTEAVKNETSLINKFYSLPKEIMNKIKFPSVDIPVTVLASNAVIPSEGEARLCNPEDKVEAALQKAIKASSFALRVSAAKTPGRVLYQVSLPLGGKCDHNLSVVKNSLTAQS